jgi:hypothetical protein
MNQKKSITSRRKRAITQQTYTAQAGEIDRQLTRAKAGKTLHVRLSARRNQLVALALWDAIRVGAPDFIIGALVLAVEEAARSTGLPAPTYAEDETETTEQAIQKINDILTSASASMTQKTDQPGNPLLKLRERTRTHQLANYYHRRDAVQFTCVTMETISFEEARSLTEQILSQDIETPERLIRLVAGIAAYENPEYRQQCALHVIEAVFLRSQEGTQGMTDFVEGVNAWLGEGVEVTP